MRLYVNGLRLIFEKNKKPHVHNKASRTRHESPHGFASTTPTYSGELLLLLVVEAFTGAAYLLIGAAYLLIATSHWHFRWPPLSR